MSAPECVVVGSGPNGLAAAVALARQGRSVLVVEGADELGGGTRSAELTLPGFVHDVCSAVQPMALASPFLRTLPLHEHGLEWVTRTRRSPTRSTAARPPSSRAPGTPPPTDWTRTRGVPQG
jgi:phytoene dehydrogenase-like protein